MTEDKARNYFRVEYPMDERPSFVTKNRKLNVINLSEKGLHFGPRGRPIYTVVCVSFLKIPGTSEKEGSLERIFRCISFSITFVTAL